MAKFVSCRVWHRVSTFFFCRSTSRGMILTGGARPERHRKGRMKSATMGNWCQTCNVDSPLQGKRAPFPHVAARGVAAATWDGQVLPLPSTQDAVCASHWRQASLSNAVGRAELSDLGTCACRHGGNFVSVGQNILPLSATWTVMATAG